MCTGVRLIAENGAVVYGRTLEFGRSTESQIIIIPRNYALMGTVPSGTPAGLAWKSRYAVVGANALTVVGVIDGVNECGLSGGVFYFPGYAEFEQVTQQEYHKTLAPWELLTWLLTTCATVDEVRHVVTTIRVGQIVFPPWGFVPPLHFIVHDRFGKSLVIEYVQGKLFLHDNNLGVFTNSPDFAWHLTNLNNYAHLSPLNPQADQSVALGLTPFGQGAGMLGLPGDFTPTARFVRAAFFSAYAVPSRTADEARMMLFHILDLFNIPMGIVRDATQKIPTYDHTQWTSGVDLQAKKYYWHTYASRNIQAVDLMQYDLNRQDHLVIPMEPE